MIISPSLEPNPDEIASLAESESWDSPWSIQVRGVPGPVMTEVAARHGLTEFTREPLMVRHPEQGLPTEPVTDSLRVRPISVDEIRPYTRGIEDGFGAPSGMFEIFTAPAVATMDGVTLYIVELDGVQIGTSMAAVSGDLTGIFNMSTLPRYRRHGYGRAVTMEMVRAGFAAGAATAYLCASEMGEPVYESAGFRTEEYLTVMTAPA
jgi:GNAT superfamily N-acetyltransferase